MLLGAPAAWASESSSLRGSASPAVAEAEEGKTLNATLADIFPDETTGFDSLGPFIEVPSPDQEANPAPAKKGWDNETGLQAAAFNTWGRSFCESHHVGTFCDSTTQVRCCSTAWGYEKCGTTLHSSRCGWHSGGGGYGPSPYGPPQPGYGQPTYPAPQPPQPGYGGWHIHQGWHQSSFCHSHHTGYFCAGHRKVHCCNDYGHFVDCTTHSELSWRC